MTMPFSARGCCELVVDLHLAAQRYSTAPSEIISKAYKDFTLEIHFEFEKEPVADITQPCAQCGAGQDLKIKLTKCETRAPNSSTLMTALPVWKCVATFVSQVVPDPGSQAVPANCDAVKKSVPLPTLAGQVASYEGAHVVLKHVYSHVLVTLEVQFGNNVRGASHSCCNGHAASHPCCIMRKNMETLLWGNKSDVTFIVRDEKVQAHSQILSACSAVFDAMFELPTQDRSSGLINITDAHPTAFKEMIRFIYTGLTPIWSGQEEEEELLFGIMFLADKYALSPLMLECQQQIMSSMEVSNTCERLKVINLLCPDLVHAVLQEFVQANIYEVMDSPSWDKLEKDDPKLACEVLKYCMKKNREANRLVERVEREEGNRQHRVEPYPLTSPRQALRKQLRNEWGA